VSSSNSCRVGGRGGGLLQPKKERKKNRRKTLGVFDLFLTWLTLSNIHQHMTHSI